MGRAGALVPRWRSAIPLVLILGLGAIDVIPERAALVAATILALLELAATGAYAAIRHDAGPVGTLLSRPRWP